MFGRVQGGEQTDGEGEVQTRGDCGSELVQHEAFNLITDSVIVIVSIQKMSY